MSKSGSKNTILVIVIILILLSCCCITTGGAIGGYYWYNNKQTQEDKEIPQENTTDIKNNNDNGNVEDIKEDVKIDVDPLLYTNDEYNFSIQLENGWEEYKVEKEEGSDFKGYIASFSFTLPSESAGDVMIFDITIYTQSQWEPYEDYYDLWGNTYILGTNENYVYVFSHMNGVLPQDLEDKQVMYNLDEIRDSFKFL